MRNSGLLATSTGFEVVGRRRSSMARLVPTGTVLLMTTSLVLVEVCGQGISQGPEVGEIRTAVGRLRSSNRDER